jgi:hypothetical protein
VKIEEHPVVSTRERRKIYFIVFKVMLRFIIIEISLFHGNVKNLNTKYPAELIPVAFCPHLVIGQIVFENSYSCLLDCGHSPP